MGWKDNLMFDNVSPFFRSPFTDLTGCMVNAQHYDKCAKLEMKMMECFEAYGIVKGKEKCDDLLQDFRECYSLRKQQLRSWDMRNERTRQIGSGELKEKFQQPGPRIDSF